MYYQVVQFSPSLLVFTFDLKKGQQLKGLVLLGKSIFEQHLLE
jgi:hypothetical protein